MSAEAKKQAYEAMHDVIYRTAGLNGARVMVACQGVEDVGFDIVTGAMAGLVSWAMECCPEDMAEEEFAARLMIGFQEAFTAANTLTAPAAGTA